MTGAESFATQFVPGLLDPLRAAPAMLMGPGARRRYDVYRNNVTVSLIEALAAIFPVVRRLTGEAFFRAMARTHIRATPPRSPLLFEYGHDFPAFIEGYEYGRDLPWLSDVARLERMWLDAYHADEALPLPPSALATVPPERLTGLRLVPHPAMRLLRSAHPAPSIFAMHRGDGPVRPLEAMRPEDALVTRPGHEIEVRRLPPGAGGFLTALLAGQTLGAAAAAGFAEAEAFDLSGNIAGMIAAGAFTAIRQGGAR